MNKEWIDDKLNMLYLKLRDFSAASVDSHKFLFEPTENVYKKLESGDEKDLRYVASSIAAHLGIASIPIIRYDWGLKMEPEVAGQIRSDYYSSYIQIPFFYVGKKYSLGGILAHELTHHLLYSRHIALVDSNENELFTDLTAVFVGLGKLLLNGTLDAGGGLGYLSPDLITYCLKKMCSAHNIDVETALQNLTSEARGLIEHT
jgi:hypothetical protein